MSLPHCSIITHQQIRIVIILDLKFEPFSKRSKRSEIFHILEFHHFIDLKSEQLSIQFLFFSKRLCFPVFLQGLRGFPHVTEERAFQHKTKQVFLWLAGRIKCAYYGSQPIKLIVPIYILDIMIFC